MGFYKSNPLFYQTCHNERIHMPSLLAHQPGPGSHTGLTFSEKFAQIWTKNIENVEHCLKWVAMARYEPILRECEATPSLNPLACLPSLGPGPGAWALVPGPGPLSLVPGPGPLSLVPGPGPWSLVPGPGPWSLVPRGPWGPSCLLYTSPSPRD